jgi:hypothetical protein
VKDSPGDHPEPPGDLATRVPLLFTLAAGQVLSRIHRQVQKPIFFGRTGGNRFDSPSKSYGVLYLGLDEHCAFIETFGQPTGTRLVTRKALEDRHLAYLTATLPLTLIDLATTGGLVRIGADGRLLTGSRAVARRWSAALRDHSTHPVGILYPARHDLARHACALFDLSPAAFHVKKVGSLLDPIQSRLLANILDTYRFGLID